MMMKGKNKMKVYIVFVSTRWGNELVEVYKYKKDALNLVKLRNQKDKKCLDKYFMETYIVEENFDKNTCYA